MADVGFVSDSDVEHMCVGRDVALQMAFSWRLCSDKTVVYTNFGLSNGMKLGIEHAASIRQEIEYRSIDK